jgi:fatty acid desaturase
MSRKSVSLWVEVVNWIILLLAFGAVWACLWGASHGPWWVMLPASVGFALFNNTIFALLHEAVHGVASPNPVRNEWIGHLAACTLPTSLTMQRVAHLGHHRRNRTDEELYDYYLPHQQRWLRNMWLYGGNLMGAYWGGIPLLGLFYLLAPWAWCSRFFVEKVSPYLAFGPYVAEMARLPIRKVWPEIARAYAYQLAIFYLLDLNAPGWILAHWFFALYWSALQYVDHAWSARDVIEGAWNLKVPGPIRWIALNYHYHLAHHRHPDVPWVHLPELVDPNSYQPTFAAIYLSLWGGVRPAPPMGAPADLSIFEKKPPS